jgi:hypothetical protein
VDVSTRRMLFLHIGLSKTGTSALQTGLRDSVAQLAEQGVGFPLGDRAVNNRRMLRPLGWRPARGFVRPVNPKALGRLCDSLRASDGERLLISNEDLCELDDERVRALVAALTDSGFDVQVVVSARNLAVVIPSEWQQFLKVRMTETYPEFLADLRARRGPWAELFWQRQDLGAVLERWSDVAGPAAVHAVATPDRRSDPDGLYRLFGSIVGFDPERVTWPDQDVNSSWGYTEAEVYRRLNLALGSRLSRRMSDYNAAVRIPLRRGVLPRKSSRRISLPPEDLPWVRAAADETLATIERLAVLGLHFHGDTRMLVPTEQHVAEPVPPSDAEIADAALGALANLAVYSFQRSKRATATGGPATDRAAPAPRSRRAWPGRRT